MVVVKDDGWICEGVTERGSNRNGGSISTDGRWLVETRSETVPAPPLIGSKEER